MASGVGVNPACLEKFQELKLKKQYKYIIFGLNDTNTEIVVLHTSSDATLKLSHDDIYAEFLEQLPKDGCRYAIVDFEFEKQEGGGKRNKICFVTWSPDDAKIKQKMLYASSKEALRRSLVGIAVEIQGTDYEEVAFETVLQKASKGA